MRQAYVSEFKQETLQENAQQEGFKKWYQARVEAVRAHVTVHDVLRRNGVSLTQSGSDRQEQVSCPFHGEDNSPSARIYPESTKGPSAMWCFKCQERLDVFGLWKKFTGEEKFSKNLYSIEKAFGLVPPEAPPREVDNYDPAIDEFFETLQMCEARLKMYRKAFDMRGYLSLGSILDRLGYQVEEQKISPVKAKGVLAQVLTKISEKASLLGSTRHAA